MYQYLKLIYIFLDEYAVVCLLVGSTYMLLCDLLIKLKLVQKFLLKLHLKKNPKNSS